jgi:hypothetical protein
MDVASAMPAFILPLACPLKVVNRLLQDGFDFGVQGDVRLRETVDVITPAGTVGSGGFESEMEKAADVIVLVKDAKEALGFLRGESKSGQRQRASEAAGELAIFFEDVAQA